MKPKLALLFSLLGLLQLALTCRRGEPFQPDYVCKQTINYDSLRLTPLNTAKFNITVAEYTDTLYRNSFALELIFEMSSSVDIYGPFCYRSIRTYRDSLKSITIWGIDLTHSDTLNLTPYFVDYRGTPLLDLATEHFSRSRLEPTNHRLIPFKALFKVEATFTSGKIFRANKRLNFWK